MISQAFLIEILLDDGVVKMRVLEYRFGQAVINRVIGGGPDLVLKPSQWTGIMRAATCVRARSITPFTSSPIMLGTQLTTTVMVLGR